VNTLRIALVVGLVDVVAVLGIIALAITGNEIPDSLPNIAFGALTGLVGLLVPAPSER
jgi:hypothetical protein